jgi:hypothetical protein
MLQMRVYHIILKPNAILPAAIFKHIKRSQHGQHIERTLFPVNRFAANTAGFIFPSQHRWDDRCETLLGKAHLLELL